jgi:hypothetical protein
MTTPSSEQHPGPVDDATVEQSPGEASALPDSQPAGGGHEREVGVTAAVERGPAETSSEGDPVQDDEHVSVTGDEPARSTDDR